MSVHLSNKLGRTRRDWTDILRTFQGFASGIEGKKWLPDSGRISPLKIEMLSAWTVIKERKRIKITLLIKWPNVKIHSTFFGDIVTCQINVKLDAPVLKPQRKQRTCQIIGSLGFCVWQVCQSNRLLNQRLSNRELTKLERSMIEARNEKVPSYSVLNKAKRNVDNKSQITWL